MLLITACWYKLQPTRKLKQKAATRCPHKLESTAAVDRTDLEPISTMHSPPATPSSDPAELEHARDTAAVKESLANKFDQAASLTVDSELATAGVDQPLQAALQRLEVPEPLAAEAVSRAFAHASGAEGLNASSLVLALGGAAPAPPRAPCHPRPVVARQLHLALISRPT